MVFQEEGYKRSYSEFGDSTPLDMGKVKDEEIVKIKKPFYKRELFKNTVRAAFLTSALAVGTLFYVANQNHKQLDANYRADISRIESFCESPQFQQYCNEIQQQVSLGLDYISAAPDLAHEIIPSAVKFEQEHKKPQWTYLLPSESVNAFDKKGLIERMRNLSRLLYERDSALDKEVGRKVILHGLSRCLQDYLQSDSKNSFPQRMTLEFEERILANMAKKLGSNATQHDLKRAALFGAIYTSPALEYTEKQDKKRKSKLLF